MTPSLESRQRIALLAFFVGDHLLWYYGGYFQQVSRFYVVLSELVRIGALGIVIASVFYTKIAEYFLKVTALYCFTMLSLFIYGSQSAKHFGKVQTPNLLWFKKEGTVPIEFGLFALISYAAYISLIYFYILKHVDVHLLDKK